MPITREELYEQIWSEPMLRVAERYEVSSSFLKRVCTRLRVPVPARGYWARIEAGKKVPPRPPLPTARPGDEQHWTPHVPRTHWGRFVFEPPLTPPEHLQDGPIVLAKGRHPLVAAAEELFRRGEHRRDGYLRPSTKRLPDIVVSEPRLGTALRTASMLFATLESRGHRVVYPPSDQVLVRCTPAVAPDTHQDYSERTRWTPDCATVVFVGTVAVGLAIIEPASEQEAELVDDKWVRADSPAGREKQRQETWRARLGGIDAPYRRWLPSGELSIVAYCPYRDATWSLSWSGKNAAALHEQIPNVVAQIEAAVPQLIKKIHEGRKRREEEKRRHEEEMRILRAKLEEEQRQRVIADTRKALLGLAREWVEMEEIRRFLNEADAATTQLSGAEREVLTNRIRVARALMQLPTAAEQLLRWQVPTESGR